MYHIYIYIDRYIHNIYIYIYHISYIILNHLWKKWTKQKKTCRLFPPFSELKVFTGPVRDPGPGNHFPCWNFKGCWLFRWFLSLLWFYFDMRFFDMYIDTIIYIIVHLYVKQTVLEEGLIRMKIFTNLICVYFFFVNIQPTPCSSSCFQVAFHLLWKP